MRSEDLACPYCWRTAGEPCDEDCPQLPVFYTDDGQVGAHPEVIGRIADYSGKTLTELRAGRPEPITVMRLGMVQAL